jgi:hypothetical protein
MKKITNILFTIAFGLFLLGITSCSKDYLTVQHGTILPPDAMFQNDASATSGIIGCYAAMLPAGAVDGDWGYKPNLFLGCHPTMDTQATGYDVQWNTETWNAGIVQLASGWQQAYLAISNCNAFLAGLEASHNVSKPLKTSLDGEARAIRAFFYMWLAESFGTVPLLTTGENYSNAPAKARPTNFSDMWNPIIADLKIAADSLTWAPFGGTYGRMTKGFALSYLGDAYMWKAYRIPDSAKVCYQLAANALDTVILHGPYKLNASFSTLWDPGAVWTPECIWEEVEDAGVNWNGGNTLNNFDWPTYFSACPKDGGWGSLYLSWEWWSTYEKGDKRREASGCTGPVTGINPAWKSATNYGFNPFLQERTDNGDSSNVHYQFNNGSLAPAIWSLKYWRTCRANWQATMGPQQIYYKRLTNVLYDYAECLFRLGGNDAAAWAIIDQIRDRAWGNTEVGQAAFINSTYVPYYQQIMQYYIGKGDSIYNTHTYQDPITKVKTVIKGLAITIPTVYPLPLNTVKVTVPSAQTYYTHLKDSLNYASPVWLVALGTERRREFACEWCLRPDMQRSGFIGDHINIDYPKGVGYAQTDARQLDSWHTFRDFDYNAQLFTFPIPELELAQNPLCTQNPGY